MKKKLKINLELEDKIAIVFVLIIGIVYLAALLTHSIKYKEFTKLSPILFYYFLFPFFLVLLKETVVLIFSDKYKLSKIINTFRDWFPFLLIIAMYYSLNDGLGYFITLHDKDIFLAHLDDIIFRVKLSVYLNDLYHNPLFINWLSFTYFMFVPLPPLVVGYFYFKGMRAQFKVIMFSLVLMEAAGCIGYLTVPAIGPLYAFPEWYHVDIYNSAFSEWVRAMDNYSRLPRDSFPSLHVGISAVIYFLSWRYSKKVFIITSPIILSMWFACIYLRHHYTVDVAAGLILAFAIYHFSVKYIEPYYKRRLNDEEPSEKTST